MKILVFGATGMLGHKLVQVLGRRFEVWGTVRGSFDEIERFGIFDRERTIEGVDVLNERSVAAAVDAAAPDIVVNAIGIIKQLDAAKDEITALGVNTLFPLRLAAICEERGSRLIAISTDCVFDGQRGMYTEADTPDARDLYGISKYLGEVRAGNAVTLRTSMIGRELTSQNSLVEWFLSNRGGRVNGYSRAIYSGFPTTVLAGLIGDIIETHHDLRGLYHVSSDPISKFELLNLLNSAYNANVDITPSEEVVIDRSLDSSVFRELTGFRPPTWREMVAEMAADLTPYDEFHANALSADG